MGVVWELDGGHAYKFAMRWLQQGAHFLRAELVVKLVVKRQPFAANGPARRPVVAATSGGMLSGFMV